MSLKDWDRLVDSNNEEAPLSRRRFLTSTTAGVASALLTTQATADTLADVPPREVGADLSGHGERSKFVQLAMLPEAGPGKRNVDPSDAINSKAPLGKLVGTITPTDLHYERSHSGEAPLAGPRHDAQTTTSSGRSAHLTHRFKRRHQANPALWRNPHGKTAQSLNVPSWLLLLLPCGRTLPAHGGRRT